MTVSQRPSARSQALSSSDSQYSESVAPSGREVPSAASTVALASPLTVLTSTPTSDSRSASHRRPPLLDAHGDELLGQRGALRERAGRGDEILELLHAAGAGHLHRLLERKALGARLPGGRDEEQHPARRLPSFPQSQPPPTREAASHNGNYERGIARTANMDR
jgi:hypothetical protein